jgi:SAM-dependent methyltransferase
VRPDRTLATGRDAVANTYHEAWPPYPAALFETIVAAPGIPPAARVLEIGGGTGRATLPLAERGFSIVGLEPGPRLAAEARHRLARFSLVNVEESLFEDARLDRESFDLVVSAQAFHWVDPAVGVPKVIDVLAPRGSIAFFWRRTLVTERALREGIERVHTQIGGTALFRGRTFEAAEAIRADVETTGAFEAVAASTFSEPIVYDTAGYLRHLSVRPVNVAMPDDDRRRLLSEVARVVDAAGGHVPLEIATLLYLARRKRSAPSWARRLPLPIRKLGNRLVRR